MRRALLLACAGLLAAAPSARAADPTAVQVVTRTISATGAVRSFHFTLAVKPPPRNRPGLTIYSASGDVAVPDKLQARFTGTLSGVLLKSALVFVAKQYYLQDPFTGNWRKLDAETNPLKFFDPAKGVLSVIRGARGVTVAGSERAGGVDCWRLGGTVPASAVSPILGNPRSPKPVPLTLWVGKTDGVLRRLRLDGPIMPNDPPGIGRTVDISRLDAPVDVKAPEVKG